MNQPETHYLECDRGDFLWHCNDGRIMSLDEMATKHCYNSFKMIYNHIAPHWGMPEIDKTRDWAVKPFLDNADYYVQCMLVFMLEINERLENQPDALNEWNVANYERIVAQVFVHVTDTKLITAKKETATESEWFDSL